VNRVRVSLRFAGNAAPAANAALTGDGKEVGYVTRTGFSPAAKAFIGMGYVRRESTAAGTQLIAEGIGATVVIAPIA